MKKPPATPPDPNPNDPVQLLFAALDRHRPRGELEDALEDLPPIHFEAGEPAGASAGTITLSVSPWVDVAKRSGGVERNIVVTLSERDPARARAVSGQKLSLLHLASGEARHACTRGGGEAVWRGLAPGAYVLEGGSKLLALVGDAAAPERWAAGGPAPRPTYGCLRGEPEILAELIAGPAGVELAATVLLGRVSKRFKFEEFETDVARSIVRYEIGAGAGSTLEKGFIGLHTERRPDGEVWGRGGVLLLGATRERWRPSTRLKVEWISTSRLAELPRLERTALCELLTECAGRTGDPRDARSLLAAHEIVAAGNSESGG